VEEDEPPTDKKGKGILGAIKGFGKRTTADRSPKEILASRRYKLTN
jgi:hypothetical protein